MCVQTFNMHTRGVKHTARGLDPDAMGFIVALETILKNYNLVMFFSPILAGT